MTFDIEHASRRNYHKQKLQIIGNSKTGMKPFCLISTASLDVPVSVMERWFRPLQRQVVGVVEKNTQATNTCTFASLAQLERLVEPNSHRLVVGEVEASVTHALLCRDSQAIELRFSVRLQLVLGVESQATRTAANGVPMIDM